MIKYSIKKGIRQDKMEKEIFTIEEAAAYLQIGKRSLYKLAKEGKIPGKKVLNKWRFEKGSLRDWVREGNEK
jgi:excisionase family DNA binding protein